MPSRHHGILKPLCDYCTHFVGGKCIKRNQFPIAKEIRNEEYVDIEHYMYEKDGVTICIMPTERFIRGMTCCGIFEAWLRRTVSGIVIKENDGKHCCKECNEYEEDSNKYYNCI